MSLRVSCGLTALLTLCELAVTSMVLPRPPPSPNSVSRETSSAYRDERPIYSLVQLNTNVEKPNTDGYRLLEIELAAGGDVDETNLRGLMRAMLSNEETENFESEASNPLDHENANGETRETAEDRQLNSALLNSRHGQETSYLRPEVIPNSVLGVRAIVAPSSPSSPSLVTSNYRGGENEREEKRTLARPPKSPEDEGAEGETPRVKIEPRGKTGSYAKSSAIGKYARPKKYGVARRGSSIVDEGAGQSHGYTTTVPAWSTLTRQHRAFTSTELPKQIPTPPSHFLSLMRLTRTTPVQKYSLRRTAVLASYNDD